MSRAFVFPGQGAQTIGMGRALADAYPAARAVFEEVDEALGEKLSALIWVSISLTAAMFFSLSIPIPSRSKPCKVSWRTAGLFSPIPPVKTSASTEPRAAR